MEFEKSFIEGRIRIVIRILVSGERVRMMVEHASPPWLVQFAH